WIDRLQLCDDQGACNITCPSLLPEDYIAPEEPDYMYENQWIDGDSSIMEDVSSLDGTIHSLETVDYNCTVELILENIFGETETIALGETTIGPQNAFSFNVAAADLPFKTIGMIATATIKLTTHYPLGDGTTRDIEEHTAQRYYTHNWVNGTITHFNEQEFQETFNSIGFQKSDESVGIRIYDQEGNLAGFVLEAGFEEVEDEQPDTDSDTGVIPE
ncbi:MAG: hypothetical protein JXX29_08185, partial [Deltaproteobacteria bacterium]|nr:hypothetical protein [Deltaproteobacteria bacterium]